jgi:carbamate kinase
MRILVALGGNALAAPDGSVGPGDQIMAAERASASLAEVVAGDHDVVLTHGNGPQVGNLLVKNEVAATVVPPVPLDWCGAQTQATLGFVLVTALEQAFRQRGIERRAAALVTRTLVDRDDPGFAHPSKPIGRYLPEPEAKLLIEHGQTWESRGSRGWRRVVPSPEPLEILDAESLRTLVAAGYVVVANGGGGIPMVREADGSLRGVEAVIDKDLGAALLARTVSADALVIATDVGNAIVGFGTPQARPLGEVPVSDLRGYAAEGHFASGSMGPKVEAVCRFVEAGGRFGAITDLGHIAEAVTGSAGTLVVPDN